MSYENFKPGCYIMTRPLSEQDIRSLTADIVSYTIMGNKVPDVLANKILVEQYLRAMFKRLPESVMTYVFDQNKAAKAAHIASGSTYPFWYGYQSNSYPQGCIPQFIMLEDPKNPTGPGIEYPVKCIEEFFSF